MINYVKLLINNMNTEETIKAIIACVFFIFALIVFNPFLIYLTTFLFLDVLFGPTYSKNKWYRKIFVFIALLNVILLCYMIIFVII